MLHDISYYRIIHGTNGVESQKEAEVRAAREAIHASFAVTINWERIIKNGEERELHVIPTDDYYTKKIKARPEDDLKLGDIVEWADSWWIVNTVDAESQIGAQGTMVQCNICLRWQLPDGTIHEEYGWNKDVSKYSFGETGTTYMDTPQFTMKAIFQINSYTLTIRRGRRFLLGLHGDGLNPLAAEVSRVNGLTNLYIYKEGTANENSGLVEITLHETQFNPHTDNIELGVADYDESLSYDTPTQIPAPAEPPAVLQGPPDPVTNEGGEWF